MRLFKDFSSTAVVILSAAIIAIGFASQGHGHQSEMKEECHFGPHDGTVTDRSWHCHEPPTTKVIDRSSTRECRRAKENLAEAQQQKATRHEKRERKNMATYCADPTKPGHAEMCQYSRRKVQSLEAAKMDSLKYWQSRVPEVCKVAVITVE